MPNNRLTSDHPALQLFRDLLSVPSPSGREEQLARLISDRFNAWGYSPEIDGAGSVLVRLNGQRPGIPLICYAAHIDEIGMVVTRVEADGALCIDCSGGLVPWKIGECPVDVLGDHSSVTGVLSFGSTHAAVPGAPGWPDTRILTGLSPEKLAAAGVRPGSTAVPVRAVCGPILFGDDADPLVAAWTFDDRMGVVALMRLLQSLSERRLQPLHSTIVAFTCREEVGGQGAIALAQREKPDIFIAIDGCPMPPGCPLQLDDRPAIWSKDSISHYDQSLIAKLGQSAAAAGTQLQPVVYDHAASDASLAFATGAVSRIACFGHPRENSHGYEVARLSVFDNVLNTLLEFVTHCEL